MIFRYPLEENVKENEAEDQRCLAQVEEILEKQTKIGNPVVGVIVEPVQSEGGDHHGSNAWFQVFSIFPPFFEKSTKPLPTRHGMDVKEKRDFSNQ